jgi:hypothetical protein
VKGSQRPAGEQTRQVNENKGQKIYEVGRAELEDGGGTLLESPKVDVGTGLPAPKGLWFHPPPKDGLWK